ncbi:phosphoribosyl transferase domain-containing protein [Sarocladium implicatum]|nr:phosphoribosyl transferase domain-containing protein [Sarocladium implicatum]
MVNLNSLKNALRAEAGEHTSAYKIPLSDSQYSAGFDILRSVSQPSPYEEFIIPQLSLVLAPLLSSRIGISVLEVGPGPESVLEHLPVSMRRKIKTYAAFEPNLIFATRLQERLRPATQGELPLPFLDRLPDIRRRSFNLDSNRDFETGTGSGDGAETFDVVLFCHSMYGMKPKHQYIEKALQMLGQSSEGGLVIVFHRSGTLHLDGIASHRTALFPTGQVRVVNIDSILDRFASFIAGFNLEDAEESKALCAPWRKVCRVLGRQDEADPGHLFFESPECMAAFTRQATTVTDLKAQVPMTVPDSRVKNREARLHRAASIARPENVEHIQQCARWARRRGLSLTVIGGGHSGHCLWPDVVAVDMSAFDRIHVLTTWEEEGESGSDQGPLIVVEAGCKTGDVVRTAMDAGLTIPLGARPSVGAGLWLQGGIGHLARLHGLACDAIVGAIVISVASGQVLCVGRVPNQHQPAAAVRPENEKDLLWAMKGAGTNFGIMVSVTFKAAPAPTYWIRNWVVPISNTLEAQLKLHDFDQVIARNLPRNCSADAYLYWEADKLCLGVTMFEASTTTLTSGVPTSTSSAFNAILGEAVSSKTVDGVGLFETEMYMSGMHGGHVSGKTSSFKRCLFLKSIGDAKVSDVLVAAFGSRPSSLCYLHLLQGGGAIVDMAEDATAFGCRQWDFACVITGVWSRDQDGTQLARAATEWVYKVAQDLLPYSNGAYSADLGPDPRDGKLAVKAFGKNRPRLARLKRDLDPGNVLAYACPLPKAPMRPKLVVLVTGESGAGKDFCANVWVSAITDSHGDIVARAASISDAIKLEYAEATGADFGRLREDRAYKEQHRPALTTYFQDQVRLRPWLPEEQFLNTVHAAVDVDVLFITGMRDEAPLATLSHLLPDSRLIEVRVQASTESRRIRRGCPRGDGDDGDVKYQRIQDGSYSKSCPSCIFTNETAGDEAATRFAASFLSLFISEDLRKLESMVRSVPDFPRESIEFQHVLNISQQRGGLALCTSLLQAHFAGDWTKIDRLVCCEVGGLVFASALAAHVGVPLALIRKAGKLPPPTLSVTKSSSYISSSATRGSSSNKRIEIGWDAIPQDATVVVVDDVLASGNTLCAVLQLLREAGLEAENVKVMVVAEFPVHRGRELLRQRGFGGVTIQSLLVFGGA